MQEAGGRRQEIKDKEQGLSVILRNKVIDKVPESAQLRMTKCPP